MKRPVRSSGDKKIMELIRRLQAQNAALISVLRETPAVDERPILDFARWERYQQFMDAELSKYGLE